MQSARRGIVCFAKDLWDYYCFCARFVEIKVIVAMSQVSSAGARVGGSYIINNNISVRQFRRSKPHIAKGRCLVAVLRGFDMVLVSTWFYMYGNTDTARRARKPRPYGGVAGSTQRAWGPRPYGTGSKSRYGDAERNWTRLVKLTR